MLPSFLECIPCIFNQLVDVVHFNKMDDETGMNIMEQAMSRMQNYDLLKGSAPEITAIIHKDIRELTGIDDLYYQAKRESNKLAMSLQKRVKGMIIDSENLLDSYVKMAIAGNVMDYGTRIRYSIEDTIDTILHSPFAINDFDKFSSDLAQNGKKILYIGDNAGEIVFDKIFIEYLSAEYQHQITYLVKSEPILNDVLLEDAIEVGLDKLVRVLESGSVTPGTLYKQMKPEIKKLYEQADFIISKGQGNFETLPRELTKTYFLLKMKCPKIAEMLGIKLGDLIVQQVERLQG